MSRVLTVGETMVLLDPLEDGPLALGSQLTLRIAGAESNFAIALARLGLEVTWVSRVGDDLFGRVIEEALAAEGVDLRFLVRDAGAPTGVFFKWREGGRSHVCYYRKGSAASVLGPDDVPDEALDGVELVHLSGITIAIGAGALVVDLARRARARGAQVLFDPNWRPALWSSPQAAAAAQSVVLPHVDWVLCGEEEGRLIFGGRSPDEIAAAVRAAGAGDAVVRVGGGGAVVHGELVPPPRQVEVVDEIGAGDGFAAGFAWGLLHGLDRAVAVRCGHVVASRALAGTGDWETFPRLEEIESELPHRPGR